MFLYPYRRVIGSIILVFWYSLAIPESGVNGSFASISRAISSFSDINLLMKFVRSVIIFSRISVDSLSEFFKHTPLLCCLSGYACFVRLLTWSICINYGNSIIIFSSDSYI